MALNFQGDRAIGVLNDPKNTFNTDDLFRVYDGGILVAGGVSVDHGDFVSWDGTKWVKETGIRMAVTTDSDVGSLAQQSSNIAEAFSESSTYAIGEVVIGPDGTLYQCTTAVETAGEWDPAHWTQTTISEVIDDKIDEVTLLISDYCKGDGVTDVSDALQEALNDAEGKTLILQAGVYIFSKTLVVPSNTKVIGNGSKSVLKITSDRTLYEVPWRTDNASTKKPYIMTEPTSENVLLSNFVLSGEGTDYIDQNEDGIMIQGKGHRLELVEVHHINYDYASFLTRSCLCPAWGIDFFNAEGCVAEQCHAYNCGYESIGCEKSTDITINKGRFGFSCQTRVQVHKECKNIYITNNLVYTGDNNSHVAPFITLDANQNVSSANIYIIGNTTEGSCTHIAGGENFVFWIGNRIGGDIAHQNSASSPANNWVIVGNRIRQSIGIGVNNATFTGNIIENAAHNEYAINLYGSGESHSGNLILYGSEIQVVS